MQLGVTLTLLHSLLLRRLRDHRPDLLLIRLCLFAADVPLKNLPALVFHWKPGGLRNEYVFQNSLHPFVLRNGSVQETSRGKEKKNPQETVLCGNNDHTEHTQISGVKEAHLSSAALHTVNPVTELTENVQVIVQATMKSVGICRYDNV